MPDIEVLIRERAYLIWEKSGKPLGHDTDHWFQAAQEIAAENGRAKATKTLKVTAVETMPPSPGETKPPNGTTAPKRGRPAGAGTPFKTK
jgi:hypothetical protein